MDEKEAKYKVGDEVEMFGNRAKIVRVHEAQYFSWGDSLHFLYDIEFTSGAHQAGVMESALTAVNKKRRLGRLCECGAWATGTNCDEHSYWCPASGLEPYKEKK